MKNFFRKFRDFITMMAGLAIIWLMAITVLEDMLDITDERLTAFRIIMGIFGLINFTFGSMIVYSNAKSKGNSEYDYDV